MGAVHRLAIVQELALVGDLGQGEDTDDRRVFIIALTIAGIGCRG